MPPKAKFTADEIVQTALSIVRNDGVQSLTARMLASKLGSSARPVFTVFQSMEQVQKEVIGAAKKIYAEYINRGLECTPAFKGVGMQYILFAKEEPNLFQLLFMSETQMTNAASFFPEIDDNYETILTSVREPYALSWEEAKTIYMHMGIYAHGIAVLYARRVCFFSLEDISRMLTEVFQSLLKEMKRCVQND